ncbi:hypothetical protein [Mitsuokella multacida]|uniref:hypothetical protein n=1 Tax=Mitsuokella multacida TaxID=52226 RepID=UPI0001B46B62|nr:hypothetical protein [Mitsuokella multacida]
MSWKDTDRICEGVGRIVDAFQDNLPCKGHVWNENEDKDFYKKCYECPVYYYDEHSNKDCCHIRDTYYAIDKLDD